MPERSTDACADAIGWILDELERRPDLQRLEGKTAGHRIVAYRVPTQNLIRFDVRPRSIPVKGTDDDS